jgi:hypothetical protein
MGLEMTRERAGVTKASTELPALGEAFVKLSPHRTHESNWLKALLCRIGLHRWYRLDLGSAEPVGGVRLCRWCPKVKVNGAQYGE